MKCTRGRESRFLACLHVFRPSRVISTVELNRITLVQIVVSIAGVTARIPAGRGLASMPTKNGIDELRSLFF
ncbi:hypothetical protein Q31b_58760 [Novipirellula aureliae]|uniref:Uncharacterized protein n=1 Tax=Novipirellula aureliae TaxID=2527966 RepID=A0A5C6D7E8_9BACT|nr:hypothetical protein Q31b_58760 [Novipirellula aureliae]